MILVGIKERIKCETFEELLDDATSTDIRKNILFDAAQELLDEAVTSVQRTLAQGGITLAFPVDSKYSYGIKTMVLEYLQNQGFE